MLIRNDCIPVCFDYLHYVIKRDLIIAHKISIDAVIGNNQIYCFFSFLFQGNQFNYIC